MQAAQRCAFERDVEAGREIELERERREDDEHVEAEVAVDREAGSRGIGFHIGAELQRVRRDREIAVGADARIVAVADAHASRCMFGMSSPVVLKCGLNPPSEKTKLGSSPQYSRSARSPASE